MAVPAERPKPMGNPAWKPGVSGNPGGRHANKPITDELRRAMTRAVSSGDRRPLRRAIRERLVEIVLHGDDKESINAIRMIWEYLEGKPMQTVEIDFNRAVDEVASRTGAPKVWLVKRAKEIAERNALAEGERSEGLWGDDDDEEVVEVIPVPRRANRVDGVRKA